MFPGNIRNFYTPFSINCHSFTNNFLKQINSFFLNCRVWVDGAIPSSAAEIFKKKLALKIAARRVFLTGKAKYQVHIFPPINTFKKHVDHFSFRGCRLCPNSYLTLSGPRFFLVPPPLQFS